MKFNEKQRKALICVGAIILAMLIYPPYRVQGPEHIISKSGYAFLFDLPYRAVVDVTTLLAEWIGVLIVGAIAFLLFMDKHEGFIRAPKEIPSAFVDSRFIRTPKEIPDNSGDFMNYASPWKRLGAFTIDLIISFLAGIMLILIFELIFSLSPPESAKSAVGLVESQLEGIGHLAWWIYFAVMESSRFQATLGKMVFGLKVTDIEGKRISFWRATGRHFGKWISTLIILIGFVMIFFTQKKQGLHDIMSGCVVIDKRI